MIIGYTSTMAPNKAYEVQTLVLLMTLFLSLQVSVSTAARHYPLPPGRKIANQYILSLKEGVDENAFVESNFGNGMGAGQGADRVLARYNGALNGVMSVHLDQNRGTLQRLLRSELVDYIEDDGIVTASQASLSWGLDRIDQRNLPLDNLKARGNTHIYIIDTGTLSTHSEFSGRFSTQGYDYLGGTIGQDCNGHGTHCGGIAAGGTVGVASCATIHSVKVLNCAGSGFVSTVLGGMNWVACNAIQPAVASMSLTAGNSPALNNAVTAMYNAGVVVSVAAGNNFGQNACNFSPASAPEAITVGATDNNDARAGFSNIGNCLDIFAPGVNIRSSWNNGEYNTISGTSMACPHVTGAAAILRGLCPALTPGAIVTKLLNMATPNVVTNPGAGSPNLLLYIGSDCCNPNPCLNGGACQHLSTCGTTCFTCSCPYPYYGNTCQNTIIRPDEPDYPRFPGDDPM
ncbi:extracellular serine proteinase-like [Amphiura filiformis]|uniref:extracellular serine proteinase-like n=1 Tax=Amphiura filiformis TaxID=82378 RepID=UPI003B21C2F2